LGLSVEEHRPPHPETAIVSIIAQRQIVGVGKFSVIAGGSSPPPEAGSEIIRSA
jgi:hypothetical protein